MAAKPHEMPHFVRQAGLTYGPEAGAIKGYETKEAADADAAERNGRATDMGLKARYEVVSK